MKQLRTHSTQEEPMPTLLKDAQITVAVATRQGTRERNADATAVHRVPRTHTTAAALVDGMGNSAEVVALVAAAAQVAARVGARRTATIGILAAAELASGPADAATYTQADDEIPDGVAALVIAEPGEPTSIAWTGDVRVYGYDGSVLRQRSTDHTVGQYLRINGGVPLELAENHDNWIRCSLGRSSIATVHAAEIDDRLILLTSDGVHDPVTAERLAELVAAHQHDPQALAEALVAEPAAGEDGYRDDATAIVLMLAHSE
jgi:PPM family protein phosphatase